MFRELLRLANHIILLGHDSQEMGWCREDVEMRLKSLFFDFLYPRGEDVGPQEPTPGEPPRRPSANDDGIPF